MNFFSTYTNIKKVFKCEVYNEDFDSLELKSSSPISFIKECFEAISLDEVFTTFNNSLRFHITNVKTQSVTIIEKDNPSMDDFEWMFGTDSLIAELKVLINKKKLNEELKLTFFGTKLAEVNIFTFFNENLANAFFSSTPRSIENKLFSGKFKKFVFYIPYLKCPSSRNKFSLLIGNTLDFTAKETKNWLIENIDIDKEIVKLNENRNMHCNWGESTYILHASMLWYEKAYQHEPSQNTLLQLTIIPFIKLFFSSVFNYSNHNKYKLIGHRTIELDFKDLDIGPISMGSLRTMNSLHDFIYTSHVQDKLSLTRHIISMNVSIEDKINKLVSNLPYTYNSIQDSFNVYIGEKIDKFFDKKLELEKHARETAKDISDEITSSINLISRNLLTLIGIALIGFVSRMVKNEDSIMVAATYLYISYVILTTILFSYFSINKKNHAYDNFEHYLTLNTYVDLRTKNKFKDEIVEKRASLFTIFWWSSIGANIIFIILILWIANKVIN
jgi:hypothetical protein